MIRVGYVAPFFATWFNFRSSLQVTGFCRIFYSSLKFLIIIFGTIKWFIMIQYKFDIISSKKIIQWKKKWIAEWFDLYLLDPHFRTIDNKPLDRNLQQTGI